MKVIIARTHADYRAYCDHHLLDRKEYKFIGRPEALRGLTLEPEDIIIVTHSFPLESGAWTRDGWSDVMATIMPPEKADHG